MKKRSVIFLAILLILALAVNIACGSLKTMITSLPCPTGYWTDTDLTAS